MPLRALALLPLVGFAALVAGCGADGEIPRGRSEALLSRLDAIEEQVRSGDCATAQSHAVEFQREVDALPGDLDDEIRRGLREAAAQLTRLTGDPTQCESEEEPTETTDTLEEPTTDETETTTTTTTTDTEGPGETEEPTTTTTDEEPPGEPGGPGGGQGPSGGDPDSGGIGVGGSGGGG